jgi:hypothetical protein
MLGITIRGAIGLGDKIQFASFPENYYKNTGQKVIDLDHVWIFDHNPYVVRDQEPSETIDISKINWPLKRAYKYWPIRARFTPKHYKDKPTYFSIADRTSSIFNHVTYLRHPRLYQFENLPIIPKRIVIHTTGKQLVVKKRGEDGFKLLSPEIIDHIKETYKDYEIIQVGSKEDDDAKVIDCRGLENIWDVVKIISQASMFIGVDSGPSWIAACYPRIFRKKIISQHPLEFLRNDFVPMHKLNPHLHWHDISCLYFNRFKEDAGVTYSYLKL